MAVIREIWDADIDLRTYRKAVLGKTLPGREDMIVTEIDLHLDQPVGSGRTRYVITFESFE